MLWTSFHLVTYIQLNAIARTRPSRLRSAHNGRTTGAARGKSLTAHEPPVRVTLIELRVKAS